MSAAPMARPGRQRATHLPVLLRPHPHQRRAALPHRPHRRGRPALRAPGAGRRRQQARQHARHPQRDPGAPARPARRTVQGLLSQPLRRGRKAHKETAYPLPIFGLRDGKLTTHYSLTFIEAAEMVPGRAQAHAGAEGSDRRADGDRRGALLRDDARARRPAAHQQPRHLSRPHAVRGRLRRAATTACCCACGSPCPTTGRCPQGHEVLWRSIEAGTPRGGIQQVTL